MIWPPNRLSKLDYQKNTDYQKNVLLKEGKFFNF